jgi:hypothetical protein
MDSVTIMAPQSSTCLRESVFVDCDIYGIYRNVPDILVLQAFEEVINWLFIQLFQSRLITMRRYGNQI